MLRADRIRRWRRLKLCSLLCLAVPGLAIAQTQTSTPPEKPAESAAAPAKKPAHRTTTQATTTHAAAAHTSAPKRSSTQKSTSVQKSTSAQKGKGTRGKKGSRQVARKHGQQAIDSTRAREIQTALIREHYLQGEPTGSWDSATQAAMQRYQADHGWQSKTTPDSRALIKLGLGPSPDHLLNPESAMTTPAAPVAADPKAAPSQTPADSNIPKQ